MKPSTTHENLIDMTASMSAVLENEGREAIQNLKKTGWGGTLVQYKTSSHLHFSIE